MKFSILFLCSFLLIFCAESHVGKSNFSVTNFSEGKLRYTLYQNNEIAFILNSNNDTVFKNEESIDIIKIEDINKDDFPDIVVSYISNYEAYDIGLYDADTRSFRVIRNFDSPPQKIPHSEFYYTYGSDGCSDLNWHSELFTLQNLAISMKGRIIGRGCGGEKQNEILIFKTHLTNEKLIKYIDREAGYYNDKFDFIDKYWTENYRTFYDETAN